MKHLKEQINWCLENIPETRNSDIKLTSAVWVRYYSNFLFKDNNDKWCVKLLNLYELPTEDHVKRIRAKIQNEENKFLPTDAKVRKQRKINEEKWRTYLGYNPELRTL